MAKKNQEAHLHLRLTQDFKEHLQEQAEEMGATLSTWIKMKLAEVSGYKRSQHRKGAKEEG